MKYVEIDGLLYESGIILHILHIADVYGIFSFVFNFNNPTTIPIVKDKIPKYTIGCNGLPFIKPIKINVNAKRNGDIYDRN
jgi:hypothetical protein